LLRRTAHRDAVSPEEIRITTETWHASSICMTQRAVSFDSFFVILKTHIAGIGILPLVQASIGGHHNSKMIGRPRTTAGRNK
jgi:hypothetical protein